MRVTERLGRLPILVLAGLVLSGAAAQSAPSAAPPIASQEVVVMGVFVDPETHARMVVLEGKRDKRKLAMVIGAAEATGIAVGLQNLTPPRPLTHDLFLTLFGRLNVKMDKVVITDLRDNTFFAIAFLTANGAPVELDSRPSDAIALAIRAKAPVYVVDHVFDKAGRIPGAPASPGSRI
jgi:bifunctional DNase/RNase